MSILDRFLNRSSARAAEPDAARGSSAARLPEGVPEGFYDSIADHYSIDALPEPEHVEAEHEYSDVNAIDLADMVGQRDFDAVDYEELDRWEHQQYDDVVRDEWRENARLEAEAEAEWERSEQEDELDFDPEFAIMDDDYRDPTIDELLEIDRRERLDQSLIDTLDLPDPEQNTGRLRDLLAQGASADAREYSTDPYEMHPTTGEYPIVTYALHHAQIAEHTQLLLEHGARVDNVGKDGWIALHRARDVDQIALLVDHGASIEQRDDQGKTALHRSRSPEVVQALVDRGADLSARDHEGNTPLHVAYTPEIASAMLENGAYGGSKNNLGQRADERVEVQEAQAQIQTRGLGEAMDRGYSTSLKERIGLISDADREALRAEAPPAARDILQRIDTMRERGVQPEMPHAPARRRL